MFRQLLDRAREYRLGHPVQEVADDVGDQPVALGVVHDLAHQGAGLTEVIVVLAHCVSGMDAGLPTSTWGYRVGSAFGPPLEFGAYTGSDTFWTRINPSLL